MPLSVPPGKIAAMTTMQSYSFTWTDPDGTPRASAVAYDRISAAQRKTALKADGATSIEIVTVRPGELPEPRG